MSNFTAPTLSRHRHVVRRTIAVVVDTSSRSNDPLGSVAGLSVAPLRRIEMRDALGNPRRH
jgi:hypothetical protein